MKTALSQRELAVVTLASQGYTDGMIAQELGIQTGTVNSYWVRIRGKLGHLSRTEIVARHVRGLSEARLDEAGKAADAASAKAGRRANNQQSLLDKAHAEIARLQDQIASLTSHPVEQES